MGLHTLARLAGSVQQRCRDGKFHGYGKMTWTSKDVYEGACGNLCSHAPLSLPNSQAARKEWPAGNYFGGMMHGQGIYRYSDGSDLSATRDSPL